MKTQNSKRLILMRGLPSCGKSHRAARLAAASDGLVLEFDRFFEEATTGPLRWERELLPAARLWHFDRVRAALDEGRGLIVVDDDHRPGPTAKAISAYGIKCGYRIEFAEPDSPWWMAIRPLLANPELNKAQLMTWAEKLARLSRVGHAVPLGTFTRRMQTWRDDLTVVDLLAFGEEAAA